MAFLVSLLLVASVSVIYCKYSQSTLLSITFCNVCTKGTNIYVDNLEADHPTRSWYDKLFLHAPFSLWHGFTVFLAVVNAFVAFTKVKKNADGDILPPDVLHIILVYAALLFLTFSAIGYVQYKHEKGDLTSAWAIAFGLWAVFAKVRKRLSAIVTVRINILLAAKGSLDPLAHFGSCFASYNLACQGK